ncbi:MAG: polysaccharide biosynthesis protein, partial [Pseudomonadota bacterium]|nr:polysaccharide biosynthesis protein [Pseudomonadota bacterium]
MLKTISTWPRGVKRLILVLIDVIVVLLSVWLAYVLRFDKVWPWWITKNLWMFPLAVAVSIPVFYSLGFYRSVIRYMNGHAFVGIVQGVSISVLVMISIWVFSGAFMVPRSVWVNYWIVAVFLITSTRLMVRAMEHTHRSHFASGQRVIIYGAGDAGAQLAMALQHSREFQPVAFVDDKEEAQGNEILGLKVYPPRKLPDLIPRLKIASVLLAIPSASRGRRREIIEALAALPVRILVMPGLTELVSGIRRVDEVREVEVEDILGRDPVKPDERLLSACIADKSVMVTGGGGSIGSELCRQILRQQPRRLVIYEISEYALYNIDRELTGLIQQQSLAVELVPVLGSILHRERMAAVMETFAVETVYHAAAYKHVPIVEHNPMEGVQNNILGTWYAAMAAVKAGVGTFVLISTDKAVRPTNVMGATKRFAELVLQGMAQQRLATRFCMVRFGNVLASSGSVVPLFRDQIRRGGPVTVTHPEIVRYFMTIPEAAQLVIQASALAQGGDVFLLNMGEPVRIVDLARRMIHLSGFEVKDADNPRGDIEIRFTGLRPGEKLYEELLLGENDLPTDHPMIMRAREEALPWEAVHDYLKRFDLA